MHRPVLLDEVVGLVAVKAGGTYVDGTLGGGGHARALLERAGRAARLIGLDLDPSALEIARQTLGDWADRATLVRANYADMAAVLREVGVARVDGIVLDLGISSDQLDAAERGFSLAKDGPLDMRMNRGEGLTAEDILNTASADELARILWEFGEERDARRIAAAVVKERARERIRTTGFLACLVARVKGGQRGRIHPATQTFQALRIHVNQELESVRRGLAAALDVLAAGGRLTVISFHSLEDRIVKECFKAHAGRWEALQAGGRRWVAEQPEITILTRKPIVASDREVADNPRARSAKLRAAEKRT